MPDNRSIAYPDVRTGVANLGSQPVFGTGPQNHLTHFPSGKNLGVRLFSRWKICRDFPRLAAKRRGAVYESQMSRALMQAFLINQTALCAHPHGNQLRSAARVLQRFDGVFRRQSSHQQRLLRVRCCLDWSAIKPLDECRATTAGQFHEKFSIFHV